MRSKSTLYILIFLLWTTGESIAQCAMCRATVENNINTGETSVGAGLNYGILYLFMAPYLLAMVIGYLWYRNYKKQKSQKTKVQHL
ncbi:hypothetical protein [Anditalea andensis]|uniref:Uncharacterized protein n=1 Tax=Anditalea andensis TaxID=1048983 RepID=A0A074L311_9BACT|nr:hypothetical protein [Anditalea andensis]KEO74890.1 hypothetical protein EL17_04210 [Anditalea andensis]